MFIYRTGPTTYIYLIKVQLTFMLLSTRKLELHSWYTMYALNTSHVVLLLNAASGLANERSNGSLMAGVALWEACFFCRNWTFPWELELQLL
jgi:hypothetical protein